MNYLYSDRDDSLRLPIPKFILSVTGGTKNFKIDKNLETAFKIGLMKAAKTTDTWIISGGTDIGVMRLVGDAVDEDLNAQDLTVLGIACRRHIYGRYPEMKKFGDPQTKEKNKNLLNPHHSAFLIVNSQSDNTEDENEFRNKLENYIQESLKIPIFLIVVEGGYSAMRAIAKALDNKIPIILVAVLILYLIILLIAYFFVFLSKDSGGCTDLVIKARDETKELDQPNK